MKLPKEREQGISSHGAVLYTSLVARTLKEQFTAEPERKSLLAACARMIDDEVRSKKGLAGIAVQTAYGLATRVQPGLVARALNLLLDDFLVALEPTYRSALESGELPGALIVPNRQQVTLALLAAADQRASKLSNQPVKKAYDKLRPTAQKHVEAALPRLSKLLNTVAER